MNNTTVNQIYVLSALIAMNSDKVSESVRKECAVLIEMELKPSKAIDAAADMMLDNSKGPDYNVKVKQIKRIGAELILDYDKYATELAQILHEYYLDITELSYKK